MIMNQDKHLPYLLGLLYVFLALNSTYVKSDSGANKTIATNTSQKVSAKSNVVKRSDNSNDYEGDVESYDANKINKGVDEEINEAQGSTILPVSHWLQLMNRENKYPYNATFWLLVIALGMLMAFGVCITSRSFINSTFCLTEDNLGRSTIVTRKKDSVRDPGMTAKDAFYSSYLIARVPFSLEAYRKKINEPRQITPASRVICFQPGSGPSTSNNQREFSTNLKPSSGKNILKIKGPKGLASTPYSNKSRVSQISKKRHRRMGKAPIMYHSPQSSSISEEPSYRRSPHPPTRRNIQGSPKDSQSRNTTGSNYSGNCTSRSSSPVSSKYKVLKKNLTKGKKISFKQQPEQQQAHTQSSSSQQTMKEASTLQPYTTSVSPLSSKLSPILKTSQNNKFSHISVKAENNYIKLNTSKDFNPRQQRTDYNAFPRKSLPQSPRQSNTRAVRERYSQTRYDLAPLKSNHEHRYKSQHSMSVEGDGRWDRERGREKGRQRDGKVERKKHEGSTQEDTKTDLESTSTITVTENDLPESNDHIYLKSHPKH